MRNILLNNRDVIVETALSTLAEDSSVGTDLQIIPLVPDVEGNYDLAAARALVFPASQLSDAAAPAASAPWQGPA